MAVRYRTAVPGDERAMFDVFLPAVRDLERRLGVGAVGGDGPPDDDAVWDRYAPLFRHLGATAEAAWVAEDDGGVVGYARAIHRDGLRQLTELFVRPEAQSGGIGRALLERAFPAGGVRRRLILGTPDVRAVARYLGLGLRLQGPCLALHLDHPGSTEPATNLSLVPLDRTRDAADLAAIDRAVLDHDRAADHAWLAGDREGWLVVRDGRAVGYAYLGVRSGPVALLDPADTPAALGLVEAAQARAGRALVLGVPAVNVAAMAHLLGRGARVDPFFTFLYADVPLERLDRYVMTLPEFIL